MKRAEGMFLAAAIGALLAGWTARGAWGQATIQFTDVTASVGLAATTGAQYSHTAAWGDADGDGDPDLFFGAFASGPSRLLMNNNNGESFVESAQASINVVGRASGGVFADLDNDGDLDLVVGNNAKTGYPLPNKLYRNNGGGVFTDVTTGSGLDFANFKGRNTFPLDYNGDGLIDLFMQEDDFGGLDTSHLMKNLGNLRFQDVNASAGIPTRVRGIGGAVGDINGDLWPDILSVYKTGGTTGVPENRLFINNRNGTFREVLPQNPILNANWPNYLPCTGCPGAGDNWTAGAALGDLNKDGRIDIVIGQHYEAAFKGLMRVPVRAYINNGNDANGNPTFTDVTANGIVGLYTKLPHVDIKDFDNDGWMDILTSATLKVNGVPQPVIFRNKGTKKPVSFELPPGMDPTVYGGWNATDGGVNPHYFPGSPVVDYNMDGKLDVWTVEAWPINHDSTLFKNTGATGNYLGVRVNRPAGSGNRHGIGATVKMYIAGQAGVASALLGSASIDIHNGFSSATPATAYFGLGQLAQVDIVVAMPGGGEQYIRTVTANQVVVVQ